MFSLSLIGLWYIAAYAGIVGHLVLFLTAAPEDYVFGWTDDEAIRLYGYFGGTVHLATLFGGWISDAFTGKRRAAILGLACATVAILLFSAVTSIPALVGSIYDAPVRDVTLDAEISMGRISMGAE